MSYARLPWIASASAGRSFFRYPLAMDKLVLSAREINY